MLIAISIPLYYVNSRSPENIKFIKDLLPNEFKNFMKQTVFFIPEYIKAHKLLEGQYEELAKTTQMLEQKLIRMMQAKNLVNEELKC